MAKRKENGAGTFRRKGSNWNYQFSYKETGSNERKLKNFTAETKEECLIRAEEFLAELTDGSERIRADITIPDIMKDKYDNDFAKNHTDEQGYMRNLNLLKQFEQYPLSKIPIAMIMQEQIELFLQSITNYSDSVIKKLYGLLNLSFRIALDKGIISENPMTIKELRRPKAEKRAREVKGLDLEEQCAFLKALQEYQVPPGGNDFRLQLLIELYSGMRMGEINALRPEDIDFDIGVVHVKRTVALGLDNKLFLNDIPKTDNGMRDIPISGQLKDVLTAALEEMRDNPLGVIFYNHKADKLVSTQQVNMFYKRILDNAGIEYRGQHSLRHTFAARCIESGVTAVVLKNWLGHSDIHMTIDVYADVFSKMDNDAMEKFDNYIDEL